LPLVSLIELAKRSGVNSNVLDTVVRIAESLELAQAEVLTEDQEATWR
jgi:hypothetical protein